MATATTLKATRRTESGKGVARKLRAAGKLPGVVYGFGAETMPVVLDAHDAELLFHSISVENTIVDLEIEGEGDSVPVLVREIQVHPFKPDVLHVDLYRVQAGVMVEVDIPVHLVGVPEGVKSDGGVLQQVIHEMPIKVLPMAIPESFEIDVTELGVGDSLHVSDIEVSDEIEILIEPEQTIATVAIPKVEEEAPADEDEDAELVGEEGEAPEGEAGAEAEGEGAADAEGDEEESEE